MEFQVLGQLRVFDKDAELLDRAAYKTRLVLAALLAGKDRRCSVDWLVEAVWGETPPASARRNLQQYVHAIRAEFGADRIRHRPGTYEIVLEEDELDADRFRRLSAQAEKARGTGDLESASRHWRAALDLWHGPAFGDFAESQPIVAAGLVLDQMRLSCVAGWAEVELTLGRAAQVAVELAEWVRTQPFEERLAGHLMLALHRSGRQAEALQVFRDIRVQLREQLGLEPGRALQELHTSILQDGDARGQVAAGPRELPASVADFTGRDEALNRLDTWYAEQATSAGPMIISAISGIGGVGKTALALHWAHRAAVRFPDGQLYLNLRGYHRQDPMAPAEALGQVLRSLGISPEKIPAEVDAAARLLRSRLAGQRVLLLLDNAATADQVRPLLPASPSCLVIVTSRDHLTGLIARDGAKRIGLDTLTPAESLELLRRLLGTTRVDVELQAAAVLTDRCGYLPLALRVAAANLMVRERLRIDDYVWELTAIGTLSTLELTNDPDTSVRTIFAQSYQHLNAMAGRLFRLLGLVPATDIALCAIASLCGWDLKETDQHVSVLCGASLLVEHRPGRYAMHDLLKGYASELAQSQDTEQERAEAMLRLLGHYTHTAVNAVAAIAQNTEPIQLNTPAQGTLVREFAESDDGRIWFATEHSALLTTLDHAVQEQLDAQAWDLAAAIATHLDWSGHWNEFVTSQQAAVRAAQRLGDLVLEARAHRGLGRVYPKLNQDAAAHAHLQRALELYERLGDRIAMAHTHINISMAYDRLDLHAQALPHAEIAYELYEAADEKARMAYALNNIGWHKAHLGRYDEALRSCEQAVNLHQSTGNRAGEASAVDSLSYVHYRCGDYVMAGLGFERAIVLFQQIGNRLLEAHAFDYLGDVRVALGSDAQARTAWESALLILDELGQDRAESVRGKLSALA